MVFEQPDDGKGCAEVAKSWFVGGDTYGELNQAGRPLHVDRLGPAHLLAIEVNLRADDPEAHATTNALSVHAYDATNQAGFLLAGFLRHPSSIGMVFSRQRVEISKNPRPLPLRGVRGGASVGGTYSVRAATATTSYFSVKKRLSCSVHSKDPRCRAVVSAELMIAVGPARSTVPSS